MDALEGFSDPRLCRVLLDRIRAELGGGLRFMEVCGTHTVSIFRSGVRSLLPEGVTHLSGPGCPVCVTHDNEVAAFLKLAITFHGRSDKFMHNIGFAKPQ